MSFAPNPATALNGGTKSFTSGAAPSIEIPISLLFTIVTAIILCIVVGVVDFQDWMFHYTADWVIATHNALLDFGTSLYQSTVGWAKFNYTSFVSAYKFLDELNRINLATSTNQVIVVTAVEMPGGGVMIVIEGHPSDLPMSRMSQYLEIGLYRYYQPLLQASPDTASTANVTAPEGSQINASCADLRNGTSANGNAPDTVEQTRPTRSVAPTAESPVTLEQLPTTQEEARAAFVQHQAELRGTATVRLSQLAPLGVVAQDGLIDKTDRVDENSESDEDAMTDEGDEYDGMGVEPLDVDAYTRD